MEKPNPKIVAVAVIEKDGNILIGKRKRGKFLKGVWEFPGGTVEKGETLEQCLLRELQEEFGSNARVMQFICSCDHVYSPDFTLRLEAYRVRIDPDDLTLHAHDEIRWVPPGELRHYLHGGASQSLAEKLSVRSD
jgi:8-oxo-dGTP diphosphatase